jgi:hypothetical protein
VSGRGIDPCSSGSWFFGWRARVDPPRGTPPVARARTWLLSVGWQRGGPIDFDDVPGRAVSRPRRRGSPGQNRGRRIT